jgi:outer membrane protein TolC
MLIYSEKILQADYDRRFMAMEVSKQRADFMPRIDAEARYGRLGNAERVSPRSGDFTMLLKVSVPIFSGLSTSHRVDSVAAAGRSRAIEAEYEKAHLVEDLDALVATINTVQKRLDLEELNLQKSRDYYATTLQEYRRGLKNSPDMVVASERVLDAKIRNLEFRRDLAIAVAKVRKISGPTAI